MTIFITHKAGLKNNFTGINTSVLGQATGELKFCGLKLYLYLAGNKDGFTHTLNPTVFANWMGIDYGKNGRSVRKTINDGIDNLIEYGYLVRVGDNKFEFFEDKKPQ